MHRHKLVRFSRARRTLEQVFLEQLSSKSIARYLNKYSSWNIDGTKEIDGILYTYQNNTVQAVCCALQCLFLLNVVKITFAPEVFHLISLNVAMRRIVWVPVSDVTFASGCLNFCLSASCHVKDVACMHVSNVTFSGDRWLDLFESMLCL